MINDIDVECLLERTSEAKKARGRSVDLVLSRQAPAVRRDREYRVYLPAGYDGSRALPMVMVLHGCNQTHLDIQAITGFDRIADREGFIVVYPYITSHSGLRSRGCWGWWLQRQRVRDTGEVGDLQQIVTAVVHDYAVDQSRLHICGLSAGAAMSVVALATYSDVWKSGASVAGVPYGESSRAVKYFKTMPVRYKPITMLKRLLSQVLVSEAPDLLVIQSSSDQLVDLEASKNLRELWRQVCSLTDGAQRTVNGATQYRFWDYEQYLDSQGHPRLGYFVVQGVEHGWIGGNPGQYSTVAGPNVTELIWAFFQGKALEQQCSAPETAQAS